MSGGRGYAACGGDRAPRRSARAGRGGCVRARLVRAVLIVAAGIVLLAVVDAAHAQVAWRAASESASFAGFDAVMGRVDDGFSCLPSDVPETFRDELLSVAGKRGLRCDVGSHLVGFEHAGSAPDALREVQDAFERGGWRTTAAGQGLCATFSKDCGACRWAFVQCVQMPQGTSVVVQWSECEKEVR